MLSFIKKLLRIKSAHKPKLSIKQVSEKSIVIPREQHRISKTNISISALKVLNRLNSEGYEACLVGGSVRDLLLGILPKDFDVATNATPNEVNRLFRNSMLIGHRFRIVHVQFHREIIEVTTFRASEEAKAKSVEKAPSRRSAPHHQTRLTDKRGMIVQDNIFGDIHQDAWRRDFTINALYYNIADFSVVDFTNGYQDLKNRTIRLIGDPVTRYKEDPVRMLRAIRFSAKLNFTIESNTAIAIKPLAHLIKNIPSARLSEEIFKVYHCGAGQEVHRLLCEYGLFPLLFPEVAEALKDNTVGKALIKQSLENTDNRFEQNKPIMPSFLIATLLWVPLQKQFKFFRQQGDVALLALDKAMMEVIHAQNQAVAIPKRHWQVVREIWLLQYRFPRRLGPRPARLLAHPRFRAAYDFLLIRALAGEEAIELADWWTTFQEVSLEEQEAMVIKIESEHPVKPKRKKKKKPAKENTHE
jgi:poly(A) polymerase